MTTPYRLRGDTLAHEEGSHGGPTFKIDWERRAVRHEEEDEEVPGSGNQKGAQIEQDLHLDSSARASAPKEPPKTGVDLSKL